MSFEIVYRPGAEHECDMPKTDTFTYGYVIQCNDCQTYYTLITGWYGRPVWSEVTRLRHPTLYRKIKRGLV